MPNSCLASLTPGNPSLLLHIAKDRLALLGPSKHCMAESTRKRNVMTEDDPHP